MTDSSPFVHLHVHTEYSLLDGGIRIRDMIQKTLSLGMEAVAITDHGNMFGVVPFTEQASKAGIKPLLGCEVYVAPHHRQDRSPSAEGIPNAFHLILLVMNEKGYGNLSKLVTRGHLEGFYYHPRVDLALLREHHEGLIAFSACLKGEIPHLIHSGRLDAAKEKARELASIFDRDRLYLEVQANGLPEQNQVNAGLREIAQGLSLPLVATNDCHYLSHQDAEIHDVLLCIQTGKTVDDEKRLRFSNDQFYFKSASEMKEALPEFPEAISNTLDVVRRCTFHMEFGQYKYPVFQVGKDRDLNQVLTEEAQAGLKRRLAQKEQEEGLLEQSALLEYQERLKFELETIHRMGFSGYFLIVADLIAYARQSNIPVGPGRGSAAGSLAAYSLNITNIDPLKYGLLFERFLNPSRISMPDIDIDFCMNGRDEVIRYVAEKYGRTHVGQIITFGTMKARAAIRDVGRSLKIPLSEVDRIAKLVPEGPGVTLDRAIEEEPELKRLEQEGGPSQKLLKISRALEGMARHVSTHASGVVISDRPLVEYLPLYKGPKGEIMTQFGMNDLEKLGLIKFDFLGLKTLTVIKQALDLIEEATGTRIDMDKIPGDDAATFQLVCEGKTTGVFQLESSGMKDLLRRLRPEIFEDMVALMALYRPGPLGSNMTDAFVAGKHGRSRIHYPLPQLEPILKETYGVILYQEQVMKIAQTVANYTLAEADELRKAIGKKKPEVLAKHRARFVEGVSLSGVPKTTAEKLFDLIDKFGGYGFNKSHSAAYAMIAYQTAYLKAHYPVEFMAALLTQDMGNQDKTIKNIAECREMGIEILPPDINESQANFSVVERKIRFGLAAIKNVGIKAVELMIEERKTVGPFRDLADFCQRVENVKVNRRVLEGLIQCGAFDFTGIHRACLFSSIDDVYRFCGPNHGTQQLSIFGNLAMEGGGTREFFPFPQVQEWDERERLRREKEALGFYITGHPLARFKEILERVSAFPIQELPAQKDRATVKVAGVVEETKIKRTKKGDKMAVLQLEDLTGSIDVLLFPELFSRASHLLTTDDPLLITGILEKGENASKILAQEVITLDSARRQAIQAIEIELREEGISGEVLEDLRDLVFRYPGECSLRFKVRTSMGQEVIISAHERFRVVPCRELLQEIEALTGTKIKELTSLALQETSLSTGISR